MALFLFKHPLRFRKEAKKPLFVQIEEEQSFEETQRLEALSVLVNLFRSWDSNWQETKRRLGPLNLSESGLRSLTLFESDQKKAVLALLSNILAAWETGNRAVFGDNIVTLARELRPSLPYVEFDIDEHFSLSPTQMSLLRDFIETTGSSLKDTILELSVLSDKKLPFIEQPLTPTRAEALLREHLGFQYFDFIDFGEETDFRPGYYPALLEASTEFNL